MKDTLKTAMILFIPISIVLFFAMVAPERIEKEHVSKSVPVTNVNYEVQSLVKTYELTECFEEESFDTNVCCSN
jgi:hypothetical protein